MVVRFRDLPVIFFEPQSVAQLKRPKGFNWNGIHLSHGNELLLCAQDEKWVSRIFRVDGTEVDIRHPSGERFRLASIQKFSDGRWLIVGASQSEPRSEAHIFHVDERYSHSFDVDGGGELLLVDQEDKIWIGYGDEDIFGDYGEYGPNGLVRLDERGAIEFGFNEKYQDRFISHAYAMTIDESGSIHFYPYTDFYVAAINGSELQIVLEDAPLNGSRALLVSDNFIVLFGAYKARCMLAIVNRANQEVKLIQLRAEDGSALVPQRFATRGNQAFAQDGNRIYDLGLDQLLEIIGPWQSTPSSTLQSASQYNAEEEKYSMVGFEIYLDQNGERQVRRVTGSPRPNDKPPRDDACD